jgi:hypothetical protein
VDLFGAVGNAEEHYSGTYTIIKQSYGNVLSINLNAPDSNKNFLFVPGSIINSVTGANLVLELNTPYACEYVNTSRRE